jgi:hypothetical protein
MAEPRSKEYRVIWRRERGEVYEHNTGATAYDDSPGGLHSRIYQRRRPAERLALIVAGTIDGMAKATGIDPDDYACCSGRECGCGGLRNRDVWAKRIAEFPRLIEGPTIQVREVGEWEPAPDSEPTS